MVCIPTLEHGNEKKFLPMVEMTKRGTFRSGINYSALYPAPSRNPLKIDAANFFVNLNFLIFG
ncbi:MAG: hypothetical protein SRB1_01423 [Desulfobacteraceae bacterium Eth-SRB1]|nr:MAG: hypothetical protein SRB1_01423 [Desulfobacteraceae bacterium Eth-SRB1]